MSSYLRRQPVHEKFRETNFRRSIGVAYHWNRDFGTFLQVALAMEPLLSLVIDFLKASDGLEMRLGPTVVLDLYLY